jgi:hypothetical protein
MMAWWLKILAWLRDQTWLRDHMARLRDRFWWLYELLLVFVERLLAWIKPLVKWLCERDMTSNYVAGLVSVPNDGVAHNLLVLIIAQLDKNCPGAARELNLQAAHTNSGLIFFGNGGVTDSNYAYTLGQDGVRTYSSTYQNILVGNLFVFTLTASIKLGVEVMVM